jgi:predicted dinucleotide-binding enzyme
MSKPIAIIGAGNVGMALGRALTACGQAVIFGVPEPEKYRESVAALGSAAALAQTADAIATADLVILAVPFAAAEGVARSFADWGDRVLVDATNPLAANLEGLTLGTDTSAAETIAAAAQGARVVKAFNTTGAENMADSHYPGGKIFMPVCSDDAEAREQVIRLAALLGFDAVDCGPLKAARYLEPFAMTWIHLALKLGQGRRFAFARLQR